MKTAKSMREAHGLASPFDMFDATCLACAHTWGEHTQGDAGKCNGWGGCVSACEGFVWEDGIVWNSITLEVTYRDTEGSDGVDGGW